MNEEEDPIKVMLAGLLMTIALSFWFIFHLILGGPPLD